jgi:signal transduction histidine kinase
VGDAVFAAALAAVAQVDVWAPDLAVWGDDPVPGSRLVNSVLFLLATAAVAWRRSAPFAAVCVAMPALALQAVASGDAPIGLLLVGPSLVLAYAVGCYAGRGRAWAGLAVIAAAVAVHDAFDADIRNAQDVGEASYWWLVVATTWLVGRYVGSRRRAREAAELARRRDEQRARAEAEAVAAERLRIANELHDVVAHSVSVVALQAGAALELLERSPERAREPLEVIERTARDALAEMGALVGFLRQGDEPAAAQPGLADLPVLAARAQDAGLHVELCDRGRIGPVPPGVELAAYRIVQEGLTNALKHSGPGSRVHVAVVAARDELVVTVRDDGGGCPTGAAAGRGHGLVGMRERTALYGGGLDAGPAPDGGFVVEARLPLGQVLG